MKLTVELVPRSLWGINLRSELPKSKWDKLRKATYKKANFVCEICGGVGRKWPVECHEIWHYDDENKVQRLDGLIALCPPCHQVKHLGRSLGIPQLKYATLAHLGNVNCLTEADLEYYLNHVFGKWRVRSESKWTQDLSKLDQLLEDVNNE